MFHTLRRTILKRKELEIAIKSVGPPLQRSQRQTVYVGLCSDSMLGGAVESLTLHQNPEIMRD